jgi:hypothetical protein
MLERTVTEDTRVQCRSLFARLPAHELLSFDTRG